MRKILTNRNLMIVFLCSLLGLSCTNKKSGESIIELTTVDDNRYLEVGELYKANLLVSTNGSQLDSSNITKMFIDGKEIPLIKGLGVVEFKPKLEENFENDTIVKKSFQATVETKNEAGKIERFSKKFDYFVKSPNLQFNTSFSSILYMNCSNPVVIDGFNLEEGEKLHYEIEGGEIRVLEESNKVILTPHKETVEVKVYQGNVLLENRNFTALKIPKPELEVTSGGKFLELGKSIRVSRLTKIQLRLVVDEYFKKHYPEDSKFQVKNSSIYIIRNGRPMNITTSNSSEIDLSRVRNIARSGDMLVIQINKVHRYNSNNKTEEMDFKYLPITLSVN